MSDDDRLPLIQRIANLALGDGTILAIAVAAFVVVAVLRLTGALL